MVAIRINRFGGIAPKLNPRYLPDQRAQTATNVDTTRSGSLLPLDGTGSNILSLNQTIETIFRYKEDYTFTNSLWWLRSSDDLDFCRAQITGDEEEVVYYTNSSNSNVPPRFTYNNVVGSDGNFTPYDLGVPAPTSAPTPGVVNNMTPDDLAGYSQETRVYVVTYVWVFAGREMESAPSPASVPIDVYLVEPGDDYTINVFDTYNVKTKSGTMKKRWYRAVGGGYFFVKETDFSVVRLVDDVPPESLGEELPSLTWSPPPTKLSGLTNMANGIMAGFVGRDVYFCEPYIPHAWPINYAVTLESPVVALVSLDTTLVALTRQRPYFIQGSEPQFMTVVESDVNQGCTSKKSAVAINGEVYYVSPDGLIATGPRGTRIITEQLYSRKQWYNEFGNKEIIGATHDLKYFGFAASGTSFIYDIPTGEFTTHSINARATYTDYNADRMYIVTSGGSLVVWGAGSATNYVWRSKVFTLPSETSFSCMQVEAETYPLTAKIYADGSLLHTQNVTSRNMFRLPSILARDWEVELTGNDEVFNVVLAQSGEELASA